jgi:hypothetical protein
MKGSLGQKLELRLQQHRIKHEITRKDLPLSVFFQAL